ncbi:hypothetical protein F5ESL0245_03050 [Lactobacillus sp. ESL0245]|nr:hypothetical protein F5ESL0247_03050 [Lactobacillus sp. ESL0247]RMC29213.1 hypothetical protein F5ESL0246_03050 [Lactobacillus sp. ESL0246]RMC32816.1 hypothetical protein F5ESL0245_03050 [Lactobacillus sp. ESL0245]
MPYMLIHIDAPQYLVIVFLLKMALTLILKATLNDPIAKRKGINKSYKIVQKGDKNVGNF